jgi:hypothetical protein
VILGLSLGYVFAAGFGHAIDWSSFQLWTLGFPPGLGVWNPDWTRLLLYPIAGLPQNVGHFILNFIICMVASPFFNQVSLLTLFAFWWPVWAVI